MLDAIPSLILAVAVVAVAMIGAMSGVPFSSDPQDLGRWFDALDEESESRELTI